MFICQIPSTHDPPQTWQTQSVFGVLNESHDCIWCVFPVLCQLHNLSSMLIAHLASALLAVASACSGMLCPMQLGRSLVLGKKKDIQALLINGWK